MFKHGFVFVNIKSGHLPYLYELSELRK